MRCKFTMILNREITDDESAALLEAGCADVTFSTASLVPDNKSPVTKLDIDTQAGSLAKAIETALEAVGKVSDLKVSTLTVPAHSASAPGKEKAAGTEPLPGNAAVPAEVVTADDEPRQKKRSQPRKVRAEAS